MRTLATTLVTLTLLCTPAAARAQGGPSAPTPAVALEARAQALYQEGRESFHAGRFDEARVAFQTSLDLFDSPNARMYLGRALARLGRVAEAYAMLDRAARDAAVRARTEPRYQATSESARAEAEALRPSVAWLLLRVEPLPDDLAVTVGTLAIQRAGVGVAIPFAPGELPVTARAAGYRAASATATLAAGQTVELRVALEPEAAIDAGVALAAADVPRAVEAPPTVTTTRRGPVRTAGLVVGAAGLAALAAGLVFGAVAQDQYDTASADPGPSPLLDEGIRNRDAANGLFVAGGALTATGLLLWLFAPSRSEVIRSGAPSLTLSPGGVGLRGAF